MKQLSGIKKLICIEINTDRYNTLLNNTKNYDWIKCYNTSSISYNQLINKNKDFDDIWESPFNGLKNSSIFTKELVKTWFQEDIKNLKKINNAFLEQDKNFYDAVLIDGSEFFGYSEYNILKDRVNVIFLDDYKCLKTNQAARELLANNEWEVIAGNKNVRNGYAVFKRKIFINK
jgi:serine/threonine-protein kinase RIO1